MKKLKYINKLGAELEFTNSAPFLLLNFTEKGKVTVYNNKGMSQDGATYLGNTIETSDKSMELAIIADSEENLIHYRDKFNKVFNPKLGEGYLVYTDDVKEIKTKCILDTLPFFSTVTNKINKCLLTFTASNPFWMDLLESKSEVALWKGDFCFDLEIPEATGIEIGHREPSLIVNVVNNGDVECGIRVEFKALATVTNPSITNVNTQEFIKINKVMAAGETITVQTHFGNKRIDSIYGGIVSNNFNYIDIQSTFLQLHTGDNLLRYNADANIGNLEATLYYTPQYLGV